MAVPPSPDARRRFGDFELDLGSGELRQHGTRLPLPEQPLRLLEVLVEHPGVVVSREQLRERLWQADTFVDFEHGLNAAVKRLRDALGDSADHPRFIETIPKRGYRFIASVEGPGARATDAPGPANLRHRRRAVRAAIALAMGLVLLIVAGAVWRARPERDRPAGTRMQFPLDAPPGQLYQLALSPDGRRLAVTTYVEESLIEPGMPSLGLTLWVRRLDRPGWQRLPVVARGFAAWTRDSQTLVCPTSEGLWSFDVESAVSHLVASPFGQVALPMYDGSFLIGNPDRLQMSGGGRLWRVNRGKVDGEWPGDPALLFGVPTAALPDGRFLFSQVGKSEAATGVFLCSFTPRQCTRVLDRASNVSLETPGRLVYGVDGTLFSQPFDAATGTVSGRPEVIVADVAHPYRFHVFTQSPDGTIVWRPHTPQWPESRLVWFDRAGREVGTVGRPGPYRQVELSPDGRRLAVERYREAEPGLEVVDIASATFTRVALPTSTINVADPVWSPDGVRVAAAMASLLSPMRINIVDVDRRGATVETVPTGRDTAGIGEFPEDWSSDGRHIIHEVAEGSRIELWSTPVAGGAGAVRLSPEGAAADQGQLSPDDRWVAYTSDETGAVEVYVQPFLREGPRRRVSSDGGGQPRWRGDGRELFYLARDGAMVSVAFSPAMEPTPAQRLFDSKIQPIPVLDRYVVTADGRRFLALVPFPRAASPQMAVLLNWQPRHGAR